MGAAARPEGDLLGRAARAALITAICRLRPGWSAVSVSAAVERVALRAEETDDIDDVLNELEAALLDLHLTQ